MKLRSPGKGLTHNPPAPKKFKCVCFIAGPITKLFKGLGRGRKKKVKPDFVVISKSPLFAGETAKILVPVLGKKKVEGYRLSGRRE